MSKNEFTNDGYMDSMNFELQNNPNDISSNHIQEAMIQSYNWISTATAADDTFQVFFLLGTQKLIEYQTLIFFFYASFETIFILFPVV